MRSVRRSCSLKIPVKISVSAMKQMFVRASVVLGKPFEHNLAAKGGCVLHCGSLMPAAAALIHPSDHVPVSWGCVRNVSLLVDSSLFHCRLASLKCKKGR